MITSERCAFPGGVRLWRITAFVPPAAEKHAEPAGRVARIDHAACSLLGRGGHSLAGGALLAAT